MRFPPNTLRTGPNTRTPACKVEPLCPPVLWHSNYPALIANTNISPLNLISHLKSKIRCVNLFISIRRSSERFTWAARRWAPRTSAWDVGGNTQGRKCLYGISTHGQRRQFTDTESIWRIPTTTPRYSTSLLPPQESCNFPPVCLRSREGAPHQIKHDLWSTNAEIHCLLQPPPPRWHTIIDLH